jgi:RNA polymerase sigma-70 factor (ECF subfamily)
MDDIGQLIVAEIPRMRRYARALLRNRDRADDLVQDTILLALEKNHLYERGTNLRAWLLTMMHNQYVNAVRRSVRRGQIVVEELPLASPAPQIISLELRDLKSAISLLPEEQRETVLLIGLEGMNYAEVAQICDVPIGTVRSRVSRAREELRRMTEGNNARPCVGAAAQQKSRDPTVRSSNRERTHNRDDGASARGRAPALRGARYASPHHVAQVSSSWWAGK